MSAPRLHLPVAMALLTLLAGLSAPARAEPLPIAQDPLFIATRVKPAFLMALDDSGSMAWETLFPTQDGQGFWFRGNVNTSSFFNTNGSFRTAGDNNFLQIWPFPGRSTARNNIPATSYFGFARAPEFNPSYFDPRIAYFPWRNNGGAGSFADANPSNASTDIRNGGALRFDLTQEIENANNGFTFTYRRYMRIPAGQRFNLIGTCGTWRRVSNNTTFTERDTWTEVNDSDLYLDTNATCQVGLRYFPATFWLTAPLDPAFGYTAAPQVMVNPIGGPPNTTLYRYEIRPGNFASGANYQAMIQNFANFFQYYRDRNQQIIAGLTLALQNVEFMRIGTFRINNRNTVNMRDMQTAADRVSLYNDIIALPASGSTPNRQAVDHMVETFSASNRGSNNPVQLVCQVNAGMLFTDGFSNGGTVNRGNIDGGMGAPFADGHSSTLADIATRGYLNHLRPDMEPGRVRVPSACSAADPDPRLDCQRDLHMNFYGVTLGATGNIFGRPPFDDTGNWNGIWNQVLATPPAWPAQDNNTPNAVDDIFHAAINTRGKMINATTPQSITQAMLDVLNAVLDSAQDSGTLAITGARVTEGVSFVTQPGFRVGNNGRDWVGTLNAFSLSPDGTLGGQIWNAESQLPTPTARRIFAMATPGSFALRQPVNFEAGNLGANATAQFNALGVTSADIALDFPAATPTLIVDYLRGVTTFERRNGGQFRDRSGLLGDIVNSPPEIFSPRDDFGYRFLPGAAGASYQSFLNAKSSKTPMVYVGANAGMMHAFNGKTGAEEFAFIPHGVLNKTGRLASFRYDHTFYVDGQLTVADAFIGAAWKTLLVGGSGAGGRGVFAIDVTDPTSATPTDALWEVNGSTDNDVGHVMGKPMILPIAGNRWMALFGNGYNSSNEKAVLFMVDLASGAVTKIVADDGSNENNGLGNIVVLDTDSDGFGDTAYGGDLRGNLWKFNLVNNTVAYGGLPVFTAVDGNGDRQPITGGLDVSAGPGLGNMVFFGTGRFFVQNDNVAGANPQVQTFYGIWDNGSTPITGGRAALLRQEITSSTTNGSISTRTTTQNIANFASQRGWYLDLQVNGEAATSERFIGNPRLQSGKIFFTTFQPVGDPCSLGGRNWLYGLDVLTGGAGLNELRIGTPPNDNQVCVGSACGGLSIAEGAPVRDTTLTVPTPNPVPGLNCNIGDPGCDPPAGFGAVDNRCTLVVQAAGSPPIFLPRPCGRQSWRQVR